MEGSPGLTVSLSCPRSTALTDESRTSVQTSELPPRQSFAEAYLKHCLWDLAPSLLCSVDLFYSFVSQCRLLLIMCFSWSTVYRERDFAQAGRRHAQAKFSENVIIRMVFGLLTCFHHSCECLRKFLRRLVNSLCKWCCVYYYYFLNFPMP